MFLAPETISKILFMRDVFAGKYFSLFSKKANKKDTIGHTVVPLLLWDGVKFDQIDIIFYCNSIERSRIHVSHTPYLSPRFPFQALALTSGKPKAKTS